MTPTRILSFIAKSLGVLSAVGVLFLGYVIAVSEWKMRRSYDAPLVPLSSVQPPDLGAGRHMAKVAGCWAGCHGTEGEGGFESIKGIHRSAAPTLSQVLPQYADDELARLIRYGVKRDGKSSIGMIAYATWPLGDRDLADIIAHLRSQPILPPVERSHDITWRGRWAMVNGRWGVDAAMVNRSVPRWGELPRITPFERGRYLASVVCAACHGRDLRGSALESTPSLAIVAAYSDEQFRRLLRTATAAGGREIARMTWVRDVEFTDLEIDDLYAFLREHDGRQIATVNDADRQSAMQDKNQRAAAPMTSNYAMQRSARIVTPLAGTACGSQEVQSASGAPIAPPLIADVGVSPDHRLIHAGPNPKFERTRRCSLAQASALSATMKIAAIAAGKASASISATAGARPNKANARAGAPVTRNSAVTNKPAA